MMSNEFFHSALGEMHNFVSQLYHIVFTTVGSKYPHGKFVNAMCFALLTAVRIRNLQKDNERYHWLHSIALILFNGYGGGIATPVLMGQLINE